MRKLGLPLGLLLGLAPLGCAQTALLVGAQNVQWTAEAYASDDDPELVAAAIPYSLKSLEGLNVQYPGSVELLTGLTSAYVQYAYAFVLPDAERLAEVDLDRSLAVKKRARKLFTRARGYGLDGLDAAHAGFKTTIASDPKAALAMLDADDAALVYWLAAAWGSLIGASNLDPEAIADFPVVGQLAARGLELDEAWHDGSMHELAMSIEMGRPGGSAAIATQHYKRALELSGGRRAGTFVSYAESVCVKEQNAKAFNEALDKALAIDPNAHPEERLATVLMQRRARELKAKAEDLILGADEVETQGDKP